MATILCIEDEALLREDIAEELEDEGYTVLQARNGQEGLDLILRHKPDLVLCDISMPGKDGYQLLQEVRDSHEAFAGMPFIFLSALAERQHIIAGLKLGADNYITKPVDFELLKVKIRGSLLQIDRIRRGHYKSTSNVHVIDV